MPFLTFDGLRTKSQNTALLASTCVQRTASCTVDGVVRWHRLSEGQFDTLSKSQMCVSLALGFHSLEDKVALRAIACKSKGFEFTEYQRTGTQLTQWNGVRLNEKQ